MTEQSAAELETYPVQIFDRKFQLTGSMRDSFHADCARRVDVTDNIMRAFVSLVPDDAVCFDIGANIGTTALALSMLAPNGTVYAFEPVPPTFELLTRNIAQNPAANVVCEPLAVTVEPGEFEISYSEKGSQYATIIETGFAYGTDIGMITMPVRGVPLDDYVAEHGIERVDFIKIDVEGAEIHVLDGAAHTIKAHEPVVLLEFATHLLASLQGILPKDFLADLRRRFDYVAVLDRETGALTPILSESDAALFLHANAVNGPVDNLVCAARPPQIYRQMLPPDTPETRAWRAEIEQLRAEVVALRSEVEGLRPMAARTEAAEAAADALRRRIDALEGSTSWRVTKPLRAISQATKRPPAGA